MAKRNCNKGTPCGNSCISNSKICRLTGEIPGASQKNPMGGNQPPGKFSDKLTRLQALAKGMDEGWAGHNQWNKQNFIKQTGLSEKEVDDMINAIWEWTDEAYTDIRDAQFNGEPDERADQINRLISLSEPFTDRPIYRGGHFNSRAALLNAIGGGTVGTELDSPALSSWTSDPKVANNFSTDSAFDRFRLVTRVSNNSSGVSIMGLSSLDYEQEVIVPNGARHRITNVRETIIRKGQWDPTRETFSDVAYSLYEVDMEEIPFAALAAQGLL